ncbi:MAG: Ig-like domain-containing protein, partial [Oligoflexia bacterium]|nr:Ig-like domain-containing protein [Oligoflexia bacterium]
MKSWTARALRLATIGGLLASLVACPKQGEPDAVIPEPDVQGVAIDLSDGSNPADTYTRPPVADATPLPAAQVAALLARLPTLPDEAPDQADFAHRADSRPAPRPGVELAASFPPAPTDLTSPELPTGPLHLLRGAPQGDVPLAPQLSLTFDQAMVAVTGQDDAAAQVPVQLDPQPEGQWRWLGIRTLVFEPTLRFPMATDYTVTIPAGTTSATGGSLGEERRLHFRTPPPTLVSSWPTRIRLFDQAAGGRVGGDLFGFGEVGGPGVTLGLDPQDGVDCVAVDGLVEGQQDDRLAGLG